MDQEVKEVKKLVPRILRITRKTFAFSLDLPDDLHYVFLLRRKRRDRTELRIYRVRGERVDPLIVVDVDEDAVDAMRYSIQSANDEFINIHIDEILDLILSGIDRWRYESERLFVLGLLRGERVSSPPGLSPSGGGEPQLGSGTGMIELNPFNSIAELSHGIGQVGHPCASLGQQPIIQGTKPINNFYDLIEYVASNISEELAETLEIVTTVSLSIKLPQISRDKRPLWLIIVGEPSTLKSSILKFFEFSENTLFIEDITAAGILPARDEVPSLLPEMNNRIVIFPTLSLIASQDPTQAKRLFAFFESIYDGWLRRKTGVSSLRGAPVDTVIIAAITNEVYEDFSDVMIKYGHRWLVYPQELPREKFVEIARRIESIDMRSVRMVASMMMDRLLSEFSPDVVRKHAVSKEFEEDLRILADMMARLRVAYHVRRTFDEETKKMIEEVEITQTDYPIRAYNQLRYFVVLNSALRGWRRIVGVTEVDYHAMRLAAKLAVSSTTLSFIKIMKGIAKVIDGIAEHGGMLPSIRELTKLCGMARTTLWRRLMVLEALGIITSHEEEGEKVWFLEEKYLEVLQKYLGKRGGSE